MPIEPFLLEGVHGWNLVMCCQLISLSFANIF